MSKPGEAGQRHAAVLFADIVGLNELLQSDHELGEQLARTYHEIESRNAPEHRGRVISHGLTSSEKGGLKTWLTGPKTRAAESAQSGESVLEFRDPRDALNCAMAIQRSVREHNKTVTARKELPVKIGIHLGEIVSTEKEIVGESLNVVSQLAPLADVGGICISEKAYDAVRSKFDFSTTSLGKRALKNVELPVEVYTVVLPWEEKSHQKSAIQSVDRKRIAILPLVSLSPDPNDEYFADGTTEEMISTLSNVSSLTVISRTSVMQYKGTKKNLADIGRELKAGTMLEGSIRKAGNRVRITVQLLDALEDRHLWAQSYDRELQDVFAVQSDIATNVAEALKVKLLRSEASQIQKKPTENSEAYLLYLKGRQFWSKRSEEDVKRAVDYFAQALEIDPNFALAYVGLADSYVVLGDRGAMTHSESSQKIKSAVSKALQLDETLAEPHADLAVDLQDDWNWEASEAEFKKAIQLNPSCTTAQQWYSLLLRIEGRYDEALTRAMKALQLDPLAPMTSCNVANVFDAMGRHDEAIEHLKISLSIEPNFLESLWRMMINYQVKGEFDEAMVWWEKLARLRPQKEKAWAMMDLAILQAEAGCRDGALQSLDSAMSMDKDIETAGPEKLTHFPFAIFYALLPDENKALDHLEKALEDHENTMPYVKEIAAFKGLRSNARYREVLSRMGLDKY